MRIAIVGTGISGLSCAYYLSRKHEVTVFESADRLGGHTATKTVSVPEGQFDIDTGFIVFNDWTYPNFIRLLTELGVSSQASSMGFSVSDPTSGFEYAGNNLNALFARRRDLLSPAHWLMLKDIVRFNRQSLEDFEAGRIPKDQTLGEYLSLNGYGKRFIDRYLIPMGAAIWSSTPIAMEAFPVDFFVKFFKNHGLLNIKNRPTWRVLPGGSKRYIAPLSQPFENRIHLSTAVKAIKRDNKGVTLTCVQPDKTETSYDFDQVVIASHSDQALSMLSDASEQELDVLKAMRYQSNEVVLHTDSRLLPKRKRAWSSWNYQLQADKSKLPVLTYYMNTLQTLKAKTPFCVTLNATEHINEDSILGQYEYAHPIFDGAMVEAQSKWAQINGVNNTWFCGAYWRNGFHEDGLVSGMRVAKSLGVDLDILTV